VNLPDHLGPEADDVAYNQAVSASVDPGKKLIARFTTEQTAANFHLPVLLASKYSEMSYEVKLDGATEYGPAPVPPSDVDDSGGVQFAPPKEFQQTLKVIVRNLSNTTRFVIVQPQGWEEI